MSTVVKDLGPVTAYADAVAAGYTGTKEEWQALMASYASVAEEAREAKEGAEAAQEAAEDARDAAITAKNGAESAVSGFNTVVTQATNQAVQTVRAEGTTQVGNVSSEGTTQVNAVQAKGAEVLESIPADYTELSNDVSQLKEDLTASVYHINDTLTNTDLNDITSNFSTQAGYIDKNDGRFYANASAKATDYIDIYAYPELYISGYTPYSSSCLWAIYDSEQVFLSAFKPTEAATVYDVRFYLNDILGAYPSAKYVRFASILATNRDLYIKQPSGISKLFKPWTGKKWVCVGDSLTEVNQRTTMHYHDYVSQATGISVVNMGVSGTGYSKGSADNNAFYQRILNVPTDADVITIFGSFNDMASGIPLGTASDTDATTLGGCMNLTLDNLFTIITAPVLGIVSPCPWIDQVPFQGTSATNYVNLIKSVCERRSIPYLDMFHNSLLRPWDTDFRAVAYTNDSSGVHPNEVGHEIMAPRFKGFLETLIM